MRERGEEGRPGFIEGTRRSTAVDGGAQKLDVVDALGRPRSNGGHGEKRLGMGKLLGCSGRQGVVRLGRNWSETVVGAVRGRARFRAAWGQREGGA